MRTFVLIIITLLTGVALSILVVTSFIVLSKLPMQSVPITTKVVSSNAAHDKVYYIQHFVIKFASDLRQVGTPVYSTNCHDIAETLLKVALNTMTTTL